MFAPFDDSAATGTAEGAFPGDGAAWRYTSDIALAGYPSRSPSPEATRSPRLTTGVPREADVRRRGATWHL